MHTVHMITHRTEGVHDWTHEQWGKAHLPDLEMYIDKNNIYVNKPCF